MTKNKRYVRYDDLPLTVTAQSLHNVPGKFKRDPFTDEINCLMHVKNLPDTGKKELFIFSNSTVLDGSPAYRYNELENSTGRTDFTFSWTMGQFTGKAPAHTLAIGEDIRLQISVEAPELKLNIPTSVLTVILNHESKENKDVAKNDKRSSGLVEAVRRDKEERSEASQKRRARRRGDSL